MSTVATPSSPFVDRRVTPADEASPQRERRQFNNSHADLSIDAQRLATAVDQYKLEHRRRFIDFEELLAVIKSLGYRK